MVQKYKICPQLNVENDTIFMYEIIHSEAISQVKDIFYILWWNSAPLETHSLDLIPLTVLSVINIYHFFFFSYTLDN